MRSSFHVLAALLVVSALTAVQCQRKEAPTSQPSPPEAEAPVPEIEIPEPVIIVGMPDDEADEPEQEEVDPSAAEEGTQTLRISIFDQGPIRINGQPVPGNTFEDQTEELYRILTERQTQAERDGIEVIAIVDPEGSVLWRKVVEIFYQCVRAEIEKIGFAPSRPSNHPGFPTPTSSPTPHSELPTPH